MTTTDPADERTTVRHGGSGGVYSRGCRCPECKEAHRVRTARYRRNYFAERVLVDGVLIAPVPDEDHGRFAIYTNRGCRCDRCTAANKDHLASWRARSRRSSGTRPVVGQELRQVNS